MTNRDLRENPRPSKALISMGWAIFGHMLKMNCPTFPSRGISNYQTRQILSFTASIIWQCSPLCLAFQVPLMVISQHAKTLIGKRAGNLVVWLSLIIGQPLALMMYYHDFVVAHYGSELIATFGTMKSANNWTYFSIVFIILWAIWALNKNAHEPHLLDAMPHWGKTDRNWHHFSIGFDADFPAVNVCLASIVVSSTCFMRLPAGTILPIGLKHPPMPYFFDWKLSGLTKHPAR